MREDVIKLKGANDTLMLEFPSEIGFSEIMAELVKKLKSGSGFFLQGTVVRVPRERFSEAEFKEMRNLFRTHGLICRPEQFASADSAPRKLRKYLAAEAATKALPTDPARQTIFIERTLRGGQEVQTEGSVVVFGNVNPGAQITAGGSVDIRGICRGVIHAGAAGDVTAFIIADHLIPTQIRIANYVARPPDDLKRSGKTERAYVKDGQIIIEPVER